MKKWLMVVLLCLLPLLAQAEDASLLGEPQLLHVPESWGKTRAVYPHPEEFAPQTGKVGFAGDVWCYGYVTVPSPWEERSDQWSLLIRYETDSGGERIAWLTDVMPEEVEGQALPELTWVEGELIDLFGMVITDDPYGHQTPLGTMIGAGRVVAYLDDLWALVEGECELTGQENPWTVMGFVRCDTLDVYRRAEMYLPHLDAVDLVSATPLKLPDDASDILNVYELPDGTFLIAYHCEGSSRLWLRVIDWEGKKLFAKSVQEGAISRIAVTEDGFLCVCFEDESQASGTRYTYRCQGRRLTSGKYRAGDEVVFPEDAAALQPDLPIPEGCAALLFGELADGTRCLALNTGASGLLCAVTEDGRLHHLADMGQEVEWVSGIGSYGIFFTIAREMGEYTLCSWSVRAE